MRTTTSHICYVYSYMRIILTNFAEIADIFQIIRSVVLTSIVLCIFVILLLTQLKASSSVSSISTFVSFLDCEVDSRGRLRDRL